MKIRILGVLATLVLSGPATAQTINDIKYGTTVTPALKARVASALRYMEGIKGTAEATPAHLKMFGGAVDGANYARFFTKRIKVISLDLIFKMEGAVARVDQQNFPNALLVTNEILRLNPSEIFLVDTFVHESRHTEEDKDYWHHPDCPAKDLNGKTLIGLLSGRKLEGVPGCDDKAGGAYGTTAIMLYNIAKYWVPYRSWLGSALHSDPQKSKFNI